MKKILAFILLAFITQVRTTQAQNYERNNIVRDSLENPLYYKNQLIIKFNPDGINTETINNLNIQNGNITNFIKPEIVAFLQSQGFLNSELIPFLNIYKIHKRMTTKDTISITRLGEKIKIPKFWSTLLLEWNSTESGLSFQNALDTLNKLPGLIEYAVPNFVIIPTNNKPDDTKMTADEQANLYPTAQYADANINIDPAWGLTAGNILSDNTSNSKAVKVGVYDSGINWAHEDFSEDGSNTWAKSRVKGGWDYYNKMHPSVQSTPDYSGHGTAIAGIIGAIRNNHLGIAGIAGGDYQDKVQKWGVDLYSMKIFDNNISSNASSLSNVAILVNAVCEGATSINTNSPTGGMGFGLDAMNFSWQATPNITPPQLYPLKDAIIYAFHNNVSISVSAGNSGLFTPTYPASYRDDLLMKVGGADRYGNKWVSGLNASNVGFNIDFIAPADDKTNNTLEHNNNSGYTSFSATSAACPHVTGLAALMISYIRNNISIAPNPIAPEDIEHIIERTALDKYTIVGPDDETGWGLIDAGKSLQSIMLPIYQMKHYVSTFSYANIISNPNNKITSNGTFDIIEDINTNSNPNSIANVPAGNYTGDEYKIVQNINIQQPSGRGIIDVWELNSLTSVFSTIEAGESCKKISWNQSSATIEGRIYHLTLDPNYNPIDIWIPAEAGKSGTIGKMGITAYTSSNWTNSLKEINGVNNLLLFPNPVNNDLTISFDLLNRSTIDVKIIDMTGKIVYSETHKNEIAGNKQYFVNISNLCSGFYICSVEQDNKIINKKLIIE